MVARWFVVLGVLVALAGAAAAPGQDRGSPFGRSKPAAPKKEKTEEDPPKEPSDRDAERAEREEREREMRFVREAVAFELTIGVEADLSRERLQEMAELFAGFNDHLWFMTEGNFYIRKVTVTDNSRTGNVRIKASEVEKNFTRGGGITHNMGTPGAYMEVAGRCSMFTFVHEGGHLFLVLPDEYKKADGSGGCPECVMVGGNMEGFGPGKWKLCDKSNHKGPGESCWDRIRKKWPKARFPNPGFPAQCPVKTEVVVNNQGG